MDPKLRRAYYNRCKPYEVLEPDDPRYVDLDSLGTPEARVRGVSWVEKLAEQIELSDEPVCQLFTGLPGSGKSTELKRLAQRLQDEDGANLLPVLISAEEVFDLGNPIDIPDIIIAILHGTETALLKAEGKNPEAAMGEGYTRRLWNWLTKTDVMLSEAEFAVPDVASLTVELKTRPSLRQRVRMTLAAYLSRFLKEATDELNLMQARAVDLGKEGLVIIFDSLEKLRGISSNWEEVLASAERIFAGGAPYLKLPVHVLYTIPPALISRKRFEQVLFIPMIKLRARDGARFTPGFEAARKLLTRRVPQEALAEIFGPDPTTLAQRMEKLIEWSGGYPRELVRLLQSAVAVAQWPVSDSAFQRILNEVGDQYRKLVPADAFPWLARVASEQYLTLQDDKHRQSADLMLSNNAVLRYLNDKDWFDLHPAVREIPGVADEIQKLAASPAEPLLTDK
jgi:hypothetical protein